MSIIIIKFFVASSHEAAAAVVDRGPAGAFESLLSGNFDAEEALIEWESIFTGRSFEELVAADEPEVVADLGNGEGPVVLAFFRSPSERTCRCRPVSACRSQPAVGPGAGGGWRDV